ncbi:phage major capsid family protein [Streptomyces kurssanovii]|uniref:Phage major capsid protein n=1 Tax=Streptomyces kurssanovii TaxID=67312 RepID=A0ABV3HZC9_9ACTN
MDEFANKPMHAAARSKEAKLLEIIADYDKILGSTIAAGAAAERAASLHQGYVIPGDPVAKRSLADVRVFGSSVAEMREADFVADTSSVPAATMLSAAPNGSRLLGRLNAFEFSRTRGAVPVAPRVTAELAPRNEPIADVAVPVTIGSFQTVKPTAITRIDADELTDYPFAEKSIEAALLAGVGQRVDHVLVNGGTDGDETVYGLLDVGTVTTTPAGETTLDADHVIDAVARCENAGGTPSAVIGNPAEIRALQRSVASLYGAAYLDKLPEFVALPALADGTVTVPAGTVVVADLAQVGVGVRKNLEISKVTTEASVYAIDHVAIAARARVGDVAIADAGHVQVVVAAAA